MRISEIINNSKPRIKAIEIDWNVHSNMVFKIAKQLEPNFILTENHKAVFRLLLLYFTGSEDFESEFTKYNSEVFGGGFLDKGDLQKGILIVGGVGTGKTLIFSIFKKYTQLLQTNSFKFFDAQQIINEVNANGIGCIERFGASKGHFPAYIDDIGSTSNFVNHYGTKINVVSELLHNRYLAFSRQNRLTHATSNLYPKQLGKMGVFDERVTDRMAEMFNLVPFDGESWRRKKETTVTPPKIENKTTPPKIELRPLNRERFSFLGGLAANGEEDEKANAWKRKRIRNNNF